MNKQTWWFIKFMFGLHFFYQTTWSDVNEEPSYALDEMIVSASRIPLPAAQVGSTVTVISNQEIRQRGVRFVTDLLRSVPGLAVSRTSNAGSQTQVRIRGAEGNHTLVIIDGIEVNDPGTGSEFDFAHLLATDIEHIEIIRGPQSALFGSDAIGGVIRIVTKRGRKKIPSFSVSSERGSFDSLAFNGSIRGDSKWYTFTAFGNRYQEHGNNISRNGNEEDGYKNTTVGLHTGIAPLDTLSMDLSIRYTESKKETDTQDFRFPATPTEGLAIDTDVETEADQFYGRIQGKLTLLDERWNHSIEAAITDTSNDNFANGVFTGGNEGERRKYNYQTSYKLKLDESVKSTHTFTFAYEREELAFNGIGPTPQSFENQRQEIDQDSIIGEYQMNLFEQISISGGIRKDDNERFDDDTTYRITVAYLFYDSGIKLHGSYGTGTTAPSFTELFGFFPGSFVGNSDLKPEQSDGFDLGIEGRFYENRIVIDLVYFKADLEDEIVSVLDRTTFLSTVANSERESEREGIELSVNVGVTDHLSLSASYTYTDSEDAQGKEEIRRSPHVASAGVNYRFMNKRANVNVGVNYMGTQKDFKFLVNSPFVTRVTLDDYVLIRASGSYQVTEHVELYARIENLLDEEYEEIFSFQTPGIGVFGGLRLTY